jgi:hypothetical protein
VERVCPVVRLHDSRLDPSRPTFEMAIDWAEIERAAIEKGGK